MRLPAVLLVLAAASPCFAQGKTPPLKKVNEIEIPQGKYHMELPDRWNAKTPTPVIVFMHGKTVDLNVDNAKGQLGNAFVLGMKKRGYIAVCPVMPKEHRPHWWENGGSLEILDAMMKDVRSRVNVSYMLCSGFSAGANYTIGFGQHRNYHNYFAGYMVGAGGGWVDAQGPEDLKRKPIWLGCGDQDNDTYDDKLNTTGGARKTYKEMKEAGFEVTYDEFPKVGHVMDAKMVEKQLAWVDLHTPTFQCYGALQRAAEVKGTQPGVAISQLEAIAKVKPLEYWKKKAEAELATLTEAAKKEIAGAEALADAAAAKAELTKIIEKYRDSSVEKLVKEALGRVSNRK